MTRYYLLIAIRNVLRNQGFARLNIAGFSIGLATFMSIMFYVSDELRYDRFNQHHELVYRVDTDLRYGGIETQFAIAAPPVAAALVASFPAVERTARLSPVQNLRFMKGAEIIREDRVMYADQSIFDIFSLNVLQGDADHSLTGPEAIVITTSIAEKYFGTTDAVGKTMALQNDTSLHVVTAVIANMPDQSHFHADIFLPMVILPNSHDTHFNQFSFNTYALLRDERAASDLAPKLPAFMKTHLGDDMNVDAFEKGGNYIRLVLTPLDDIHLHSSKQRELEANSDVGYVYIFSAVAFLILMLACINFSNLFTARSANRAREVGIRKVMGSMRSSIMIQFLMESLVMTSISVVIALFLSAITLPALNSLSGKRLEISWDTLLFIVAPSAIAIAIIVAVIAGMYPAFYLSAFKPVSVLRGKVATGFKSSWLRGVLVTTQFSIATMLIVGTLVLVRQLDFIRNKNLGFERSQVLVVKNAGTMDHPEVFKKEAKLISGVSNASLSGYLPTGGGRWQNSISTPGNEGLLAEFWSVDADYIPALQMKLALGRNFSADMATDSSAIILNQSAARELGLGIESLGKTILAGNKNYQLIGVVDDFNYSSLRDNIGPLAMVMDIDWQASLIIRASGGQMKGVVDQLDELWTRLNPGYPYEYSFMNEDFEATFKAEQRMENLFLIFSGLAIIIAGMGLFGLSAYAAAQRTHELAVRKVLGASVVSLFNLLSMSFLKLVVIAVMIALPLSWMLMDKWFSGFAFRAEMPLWIFVTSAVIIFLVGGAAVTLQTLKTAIHNPVDNLRAE